MDIQTPRIDELKKKVYSYSEHKNLPLNLEHIIYSNKIYIAIPILILALLIVVRPNFLYIETKEEKKFSFQKLISFWLFFSLIIAIGLFGYRYKNN